MVHVTLWNENLHEKHQQSAAAHIYPSGIHETIASHIAPLGNFDVQLATLDEPEHGLNKAVLEKTNVLVWWGHLAHHKVQDHVVEQVCQRVLAGMGFVALHSAHHSKVFKQLMGTSCNLKWRETGELERLWALQPDHPTLKGIPESIELEREEMYGELFDIPTPDELLMLSWFAGGEVFRSLCTWNKGRGKVVYFRPGHETFPTYHNPHISQIIANICTWACPS
jgi:trehalose utilization protein